MCISYFHKIKKVKVRNQILKSRIPLMELCSGQPRLVLANHINVENKTINNAIIAILLHLLK
jgi:hypothetical protein